MATEQVGLRVELVSNECTSAAGITDFNFESPYIRLYGHELRFKAKTVSTEVKFDLEKCRLPPTLLYPTSTRITEHKALMRCLFLTLDNYALRNGDSVSLVERLRLLASDVVKILEYGWVCGYYRFEDWSQTDFDEFIENYGSGSWLKALKIGERIQTAQEERALPAKTNRALLTSIDSNLRSVRVGSIARNGSTIEVNCAQAGAERMTGVMDVINLMADACGIGFRPYLDTEKIARLRGKAGQRSENVSPDELGELMLKSFQFFGAVKAPLLEVFTHWEGWRRERPPVEVPTNEAWAQALRNSVGRKTLESVIGCNIDLYSSKKSNNTVDFYSVLDAFYASCFYMLAFMNARRKNEIIHSEIGLCWSDVRVESTALELFVAEFYIEKNLQCRIPFYVNRLTYEIASTLMELSSVAARFTELQICERSTPKRDERYGLFAYPDVRNELTVRNFSMVGQAHAPAVAVLARVAPAVLREFDSRAMRRAYALLFYYRYVNASLSALSQHLVHPSQARTLTYIYDASNPKRGVRAVYGGLTSEQKAALAREDAALDKEMKFVQKERLKELIRDVIQGEEPVYGNFAKLVRRFHALLLRHVSYSKLDEKRQQRAMGAVLSAKGHLPHPMMHGDCWRGTSKTKLRGHCQEPGDVGPNRAKANFRTCDGCPFQAAYAQHTDNLKKERDIVAAKIDFYPAHSLQVRGFRKELAALDNVLAIRTRKVAEISTQN